MSNIDGIINKMVSQIEGQTREIDHKAHQTDGVWEGQAHDRFIDSHNELKLNANRIKREFEEMKGTVRVLESNMQAADRDMAQKAKALEEVKKRANNNVRVR